MNRNIKVFLFAKADSIGLIETSLSFQFLRQAIVEPRYGLGFCLLPSALHLFLKYSKYSCKFVASPNRKMQKHKLCDLPFRKITDISKSQNAVILTYYVIMVIVGRNNESISYFDTKSLIWQQIFKENLTIPIAMI